MKPKNTYLFLIPAAILFLVLATYLAKLGNEKSPVTINDEVDAVEVFLDDTEDVEPEDSVEEETKTNVVPTSDKSINNIQETRTLAVSPTKCRGCGRCVVIDSEHFKMSGGVSTVITQANLDSTKLQSAINSCPADAITLG